ncbi:MAG: hypothetical protein KDC83_06770 [Flavobacteriales bacterium]|nr:hypothetical protein [Flavobacteriales bacterium]
MIRILTFILILGTVASCKKGENDPLISLKTRKGRLTGEWKMTFAEYSTNDTSYTYDGSVLTEKKAEDAQVNLKAEIDYSFDKSGRYIINTRTTYPVDYFGSGTPELTQVYLEEGIWNFTGGGGDTKTKSQILLLPDRIEKSVAGISNIDITVFENPINGRIYNLDMLKDKSMRWKYESTENSPSMVTKKMGTFEFEKQ